MANLGEVVARVADMLARTDLNTQIKAEVQQTIKHYECKPWAFTEHLDATLTTVAGDAYYETVDATAGEGLVTFSAAVAVERIVSIADVVIDRGPDQHNAPLAQWRFTDIKSAVESTSSQGEPYHWARYAGRLILYPVPDAVYTIRLSGVFMPPIPAEDSDTSVWFDRAQELIEMGALLRVASKYRVLDDGETVKFAGLVQSAEAALRGESNMQRRTGRIKPQW